MVGYILCNILFDYGMVNRGVVMVEDGYLMGIVEWLKIGYCDGGVFFFENDEVYLFYIDSVVSMNFWGFYFVIFE